MAIISELDYPKLQDFYGSQENSATPNKVEFQVEINVSKGIKATRKLIKYCENTELSYDQHTELHKEYEMIHKVISGAFIGLTTIPSVKASQIMLFKQLVDTIEIFIDQMELYINSHEAMEDFRTGNILTHEQAFGI